MGILPVNPIFAKIFIKKLIDIRHLKIRQLSQELSCSVL